MSGGSDIAFSAVKADDATAPDFSSGWLHPQKNLQLSTKYLRTQIVCYLRYFRLASSTELVAGVTC